MAKKKSPPPWRPQPTKAEEAARLERALRDMKINHYATTTYARHKQGAPHFLLPSLGAAVWLYAGRGISARQSNEQDAMRAMGWRVLILETAQEALKQIEDCRRPPAAPTFKTGPR